MKLDSKAIVLSVAALGFCVSGGATEKKISKTDLPAAVLKTAQEQSEGATVKGYSKDAENGQVEYEVQMTANGHSKDVTIAPDGRLMEVEEQVEMSSLPASVQSALKARAGEGSITSVESLTKSGKIVAYEAKVKKNGHSAEVQVGPDGERLKHEQ